LYYPKDEALEQEFPYYKQSIEKYLDLSYSRQGQDVRYALNDNKLRALGWEPKAIFDEELPSIVEYYKNNFIW
jgi:dTDP-D-glucose 4,6-dehydratase